MGLISGRLRGGALKPGFRMLPFGYKEHIETIELDSDQSSVTFSDIPDDYEALELYLETNTDSTSSSDALIRFNEDTGDSNYESYQLVWDDSVSSSVRDEGRFAAISNDGRDNDSHKLMIEGYSSTDMKTTYTTSHLFVHSPNARKNSGWWDNTDVVNQVEVSADEDNFRSGSRFVLHGVNRV